MIYLEQTKLSQLCFNMKEANDDYSNCIQYEVRDVIDWFNTYWISTLSKKTAYELYDSLNDYVRGIYNLFYRLNKKIKKSVIKYNENPETEKKLHYRGFSIYKPYYIDKLSDLNDTLPDGKVGLLLKKDDISYPFHKLKMVVEEASFVLKIALSQSDAISESEVEMLQREIIDLEKRFINSVDDLLFTTHNVYNNK